MRRYSWDQGGDVGGAGDLILGFDMIRQSRINASRKLIHCHCCKGEIGRGCKYAAIAVGYGVEIKTERVCLSCLEKIKAHCKTCIYKGCEICDFDYINKSISS